MGNPTTLGEKRIWTAPSYKWIYAIYQQTPSSSNLFWHIVVQISNHEYSSGAVLGLCVHARTMSGMGWVMTLKVKSSAYLPHARSEQAATKEFLPELHCPWPWPERTILQEGRNAGEKLYLIYFVLVFYK